MAGPSPDPTAILSTLLEEANSQREKIELSLKEIKLLIQQNSNEADHFAGRNAQIADLLRQIESNPEGYRREEIVEAYANAQDTQLRLFTMRSQVEQLQERQGVLQNQANYLARFLEVGESLLQKLSAEPLPQLPQSIAGIIDAQEGERQSLARQMHDGPAQSLTNLILQAEVCEKLFATDPQRARAELANLKTSALAAFQRTRRFIFELRPMMLDDLGLIPTLRRYIPDFQEKTGLSVDLRVTGQDRRLDPHTEVTIFRIIQELLLNIDRHAHPQKVQVVVSLEPDQVQVMVEDDGRGFDVAQALSAAQERRTLGLAALKERVELLAGRVNFESAPGRGTKVAIEIPVSSPA